MQVVEVAMIICIEIKPRRSPMARSKTFWNLFATFYSKQPISDENAYHYKLGKTQEYFTENSEILEFGCGTGSTALLHAPLVKKITATDYSKKMIDIAKKKAAQQKVQNVEFITTTLFDLNFPSGSFDVILGLNILHLLKNYEDAIQKSYELLKPGGVLITSTACIGEGSALLRTLLPIGSYLRVLPQIKVFDKGQFKRALGKPGVDILEFSTPGKDKNVVFTVSKKK